MPTQELTTLLPPVAPTLNLGADIGTYTASGFTKIAPGAIVMGDTTDKILGLQVRIDSGTGTLGVVNGTALRLEGTDDKIGYAYSDKTKLLRLTDISSDLSAVGSDFQRVLRNVAIRDASGNVSISANLGKPVYRSENGNYYEFVSIPTSSGASLPTWTASKTAAEARTFLGLRGYLASVTSAAENKFLTDSFDSRGWIGAQADANRKWTWVGVASPENNKSFWNGDVDGSFTNAEIKYANWDTSEPNNDLRNESYVQFATGGVWNDLADAPTTSRDNRYNPDGYWVEYGDNTGSANLATTRGRITLTQGNGPIGASPLDLVLYDPIKGQVSFAFLESNYVIRTDALTGDTPVLTSNAGNVTPEFGPNWRLVSADIDVDNDNVKDIIVARKTDNQVVVFFGEARTNIPRQYAYSRAAAVTFNGAPIAPGDTWTLSFASSKIGANDTPGLFWFNKTGISTIWTLKPITTSGVTTVGIEGSGVIFNAGADSGWRAMGDGEFNQDSSTREVFWMNDKNSLVVTWALTGARALAPNGGKNAYAAGVVPTSFWSFVGITRLAGTGNDNIIFQNASTVVSWSMADGVYVPPVTGVNGFVTLSAPDRIKAIVDVDGDGVKDLIGQFDGNGTIAAYALTSSFALKNTAAPRTQYFAANNPGGSYRPGKNGSGPALELVNVAQYGA